jgi:hypothetical protein
MYNYVHVTVNLIILLSINNAGTDFVSKNAVKIAVVFKISCYEDCLVFNKNLHFYFKFHFFLSALIDLAKTSLSVD